MKLENHDGLYVNAETDPPTCLGDLWYAPEHGVYEPNYGRVDVPPEDVARHNEVLDQARLLGMDNNCEIGQGSFAYLEADWLNPCSYRVRTFGGTTIADNKNGQQCVFVTGPKQRNVRFVRAGKHYAGRLPLDQGATLAFNFKRIL